MKYIEVDFATFSCSFCSRAAKWIGRDQDGDSYCDTHRHLAPYGVDTREA